MCLSKTIYYDFFFSRNEGDHVRFLIYPAAAPVYKSGWKSQTLYADLIHV